MSPEKQNSSRADLIRQRRTTETHTRSSQTRQNVRRAAATPIVSRAATGRQSAVRQTAKPRAQRRYEVALPLSGGRTTSIRMPSLALHLSPRWVSGALALIMAGLLFVMWSIDPFIIHGAKVSGNQRLAVDDINTVLGLSGKSIVLAMPEEIEYNLRAAFPELKDVSVSIGFPSTIAVNVAERTPLVAWQQDDKVSWIDAEGVAFPPRGAADGLIPVLALGNPPAIDAETQPVPEKVTAISLFNINPAAATAKRLLQPETVLALQSLVAYMPQETVLVYDPSYGLGWKDARGWQVYFGSTGSDMGLKVQMYQTIVDNLMQRGITPTMVSVEYPSAPFYRVAQEQQ
jgi:cell division septal protein FtsQ